MADTTTFEDGRIIAEVRALLDRPAVVVWRSILAVHDRVTGGEPCPCCGCRTAHLASEEVVAEVMIDTATGDRLSRDQIDEATWAALLPDAHPVEMRIWASPVQAAITKSRARQVVVDGGSQSGKTEGVARAFALDIQRRGGRGRVFWLIAPSRRSAFIQAQKLALGYQGRPPVIPPELVVRGPRSHTDKDMSIVFIDGTIVDCRAADRMDGSKVDGQECEGVWVDEVTKIRYPIYWREALNRTTATGGRVYGSSVPMPGHWFKDEIDAAVKEGSIDHFAITRYDNVRVPLADIDEQRRIMLAKANGDLAVDLEIFGRWVNPEGRLYWAEFKPAEHVVNNGARFCSRTVLAPSAGQFADVTERAAKLVAPGGGWFTAAARWTRGDFILGSDINLSPICAVVAKVFSVGDPADIDSWGLYICDEVSMPYATLPAFADRLATVHGGDYKGCAIVVDPNNCHKDRHLERGYGGQSAGNASAKAYADAGLDPRPADTILSGRMLIPRAPSRLDSHLLLRRLMEEDRVIVSSSCSRLLEGLEKMLLAPATSLPVKEPNTASDRLSNAVDGLRYLAWSIFGRKADRRARRPDVDRSAVYRIP